MAVCDTFVPATDGLPSASEMRVPERIFAEIAALGRPAQLRELELLLDLLGSPLANLALSRTPQRFADLPLSRRDPFLRGWATSPIAFKRRAFQVLKRLTLLSVYGQAGSPYWGVVGYAPPPLDPPAEASVSGRIPGPGEVVEADACVIGSGAGGGVTAAVLAAGGMRVVVLERARLRTEAEFDGRELDGYASLFLDRGLAATDDRAIVLLAGSAVGGGTVVNWNTCLRLPENVSEEWRRSGVDELLPHYQAVEERIDVDPDESARNGPNAALERGLDLLGIPHETIRRNVRGCGDCGHCTYGCRRGAKRSTLRTYLADAVRDGAEILHSTEARRILVEGGRVTGVRARVAGGEITVRAPRVALAGGAILSPALLLRSGIAADRAGRGLALHPFAVVGGFYDEDIVPWSGVPQSVVGRPSIDGLVIEAGPALPGLLAAALPWWGADEHRRLMSAGRGFAPAAVVARDRHGGRVTVDRGGEPVVRYRVDAATAALLERGMNDLARVHLAAGARRAMSLYTPPLDVTSEAGLGHFRDEIARRGVDDRLLLLSAHQMSSCRIGSDARTSVAAPDGQVWGVRGLYVTDASAFPSASGVNPMLTVMALARRTAQGMLAVS